MKKRRRDGGFTLVEVLLTTVILVLGFLIIASSFVAMARTNRYSEKQDTAVKLASRIMEDMRNTKASLIKSASGNYGDFPDFPDYRYSIEAVDIGQCKQLTVRIHFNHDRRQVSLVSCFALM